MVDILNKISIFQGQVEVYIWVILITTVLTVYAVDSWKKPMKGNLGVWLGLYSTLVHEFGHIVACKLTLGRVADVMLSYTYKGVEDSGTKGNVYTASRNRLARAITAYFGYVFPPLFILVGLWLNYHNLLNIYLVLNLIMVVYYIDKTSQRTAVVTSLIIGGILIYFREILNIDLIIVVMFNVSIGMLFGEVINSIRNIFNLYYHEAEGWDGCLVRDSVLIPIRATSSSWIVIIVVLSYNSLGILFS